MHIIHNWKLIAATQQVYVHGGGEVTALLYGCRKCSTFKVEKIGGHWSMEQLLAPPQPEGKA